MKRLPLVLFLAALCATYTTAQANNSLFLFDAGQVTIRLPNDTQVQEDEDGWVGYSSSTDLLVLITETADYIPPNEIYGQPIAQAFGFEEIEDWNYGGVACDDIDGVCFVYGTGGLTDDDGRSWEGYFGIMENAQVPGRSFVLAVMAPSLSKYTSNSAARTAINSLTSAVGGSTVAGNSSGYEIDVAGSPKFKQQVTRALALLREKAPVEYNIVRNYIGRIEENQNGGVYPFEDPPLYKMSSETAMYSITWCAGSIALNASYSRIYHDYKEKHGKPVPSAAWTGPEAEKKSYQFFLTVLRAINAPQNETDYCISLLATKGHTNNSDKARSQGSSRPDPNILFAAVRNGDLAAAASYIDAGGNLEAKDEKGTTALYIAAELNRPQIAKLLIDSGANIENPDPFDVTPLFRASVNGNVDIVRMLLDAGAAPDFPPGKGHRFGETPLMYAAMSDDPTLAKLLIDAGADVNAQSYGGDTPLLRAVYMGGPRVVEFLLKAGAREDIAMQTEDFSPVYRAAHNDDLTILELLFKYGAQVDERDSDGNTPLIFASRYEQENLVKFLISKGADINATDGEGGTALMYAADAGNLNIVKILVGAKAKVDLKDKNGKTALDYATTGKHSAVVQYLRNLSK